MANFYNLKGIADRENGVIAVTVDLELASAGHEALITDKYPGGNRVYVRDPGSAQVFIHITKGPGADVLTPWVGQISIEDPVHSKVEIHIDGEVEAKIDVKESDTSQLYLVYRNLNPPQNCIIVPQGNIVAAIYTKVFGPKPKAECEEWSSKNCKP